MAAAHPGKDVRCDECPLSFPAYNYLKLHKNIYHHKSSSFASSFPSLSALSSISSMASLSALKEQQENEEAAAAKKKKEAEPILDLSPAKAPTPKPQPAKLPDVGNVTPATSLDQVSIADSMETDENEGLLRDMKLKGEFPCRLCPAVYPNLRALKGHNKEHWDKPPYVCNVAQCTYSTSDKGTLARHMRIHTGDKPFECKECNFGFTTKANCERHVKNKHNKNSRTDVRDSIMVHEGDDLSKDHSDESLHFSPVRSANSSKKKEEVKVNGISAAKPSSLFAPYHATLYRNLAEGEEKR